jgi:hypothetical protein
VALLDAALSKLSEPHKLQIARIRVGLHSCLLYVIKAGITARRGREEIAYDPGFMAVAMGFETTVGA